MESGDPWGIVRHLAMAMDNILKIIGNEWVPDSAFEARTWSGQLPYCALMFYHIAIPHAQGWFDDQLCNASSLPSIPDSAYWDYVVNTIFIDIGCWQCTRENLIQVQKFVQHRA